MRKREKEGKGGQSRVWSARIAVRLTTIPPCPPLGWKEEKQKIGKRKRGKACVVNLAS